MFSSRPVCTGVSQLYHLWFRSAAQPSQSSLWQLHHMFATASRHLRQPLWGYSIQLRIFGYNHFVAAKNCNGKRS